MLSPPMNHEDHIPNALKYLDKTLSYMKNSIEKERLNPLKKIVIQRYQYSERTLSALKKKKLIKKETSHYCQNQQINMCRNILNSNKRTSYVHTGVDHTYFQHK